MKENQEEQLTPIQEMKGCFRDKSDFLQARLVVSNTIIRMDVTDNVNHEDYESINKLNWMLDKFQEYAYA